MYTAEAIAEKIATDDRWLYRGILAIYEYQTSDEKSSDRTKYVNGVGFNGADAEILSSFAKWLGRTGRLSDKQKALARKKMKKYSGQLARLANAPKLETV